MIQIMFLAGIFNFKFLTIAPFFLKKVLYFVNPKFTV